MASLADEVALLRLRLGLRDLLIILGLFIPPVTLLWQVVLPLCKPALGVAGVLGFIMIWDQYLLPLITAKDPTDYTVTVALAPPGVRSTAAPLVTAPGDRPAPTALSVSCPRVPVT